MHHLDGRASATEVLPMYINVFLQIICSSLAGVDSFSVCRIAYPKYTVDIYQEHADVTALTLEAVAEVRDSLQLHTTGKQAPRPIASFLHLKGSLPKVGNTQNMQ